MDHGGEGSDRIIGLQVFLNRAMCGTALEPFFSLIEPGSNSLFIISNAIYPHMGILDRVHHFIFKGEDKQDNPEFDLTSLKENLRRHNEKVAKKNPVDGGNNQRTLVIDEGNFEIIREVEWKPDPLVTFQSGQRLAGETLKVRDPLLLGVKMFLADIPHIIKGYYDLDRNNCFKFSKDVQNVATKYGIRCGLVIISFHRSLTGHAVVAFETDYGLKFFEPQSANEEDVIVGRCYSANLEGIQDDDIIIKIEISWNDGTHTVIE